MNERDKSLGYETFTDAWNASMRNVMYEADDASLAILSLYPPERTDLGQALRTEARLRYRDDVMDILTNPQDEKIDDFARRQAKKIFKRSIEITSSDNSQDAEFFAVLDVAREGVKEAVLVDRVRYHYFGPAYITTGAMLYSERFMSYLGAETANHFFGSEHRPALLPAIKGLAQQSVATADANNYFSAFKFSVFVGELESAYSLMNILSEQESDQKVSLEILTNAGDDLWTESQDLRSFGLKPAVAPSNMPGITNISMQPGKDYVQNFKTAREGLRLQNPEINFDTRGDTITFKDAVAIATLSDLPIATDMPELKNFGVADNVVSLSLDSRDVLEASGDEIKGLGSSHSLSTVQIRRDGHIYSLKGISLNSLYKELGAEEAYAQLRLELLALYHDLVVPVYVHKLVADSVSRRQPLEESSAARAYEMVIARTLYLRAYKNTIIDKLKEETNAARFRRSSSKHVVRGHVRDIPEEFSASLEARETAWLEGGVILPNSGQTWVKYHERGEEPDQFVKAKPIKGQYATRQERREAQRRQQKMLKRRT